MALQLHGARTQLSSGCDGGGCFQSPNAFGHLFCQVMPHSGSPGLQVNGIAAGAGRGAAATAAATPKRRPAKRRTSASADDQNFQPPAPKQQSSPYIGVTKVQLNCADLCVLLQRLWDASCLCASVCYDTMCMELPHRVAGF